LGRVLGHKPGASVNISANVLVEHRKADGRLVSRQEVHNLVVTAGLNWLRTHVGDSGTDRANYINLSSNASAPAAGDTDLLATIFTANGLQRAIGAYAAGGNGVFTIYKLFTCTADSQTVASCGLVHGNGAAQLFAGVAITAAALMNLDTLAITWTVTFA
jgi:hypothetical protein